MKRKKMKKMRKRQKVSITDNIRAHGGSTHARM